MVVSSPFDIVIRLKALKWGFLSPYLRSQTMVFPSMNKFAPLSWAPLSPLWHLSSKQRASLFHFSYLRRLPLLNCRRISHAPTLLLSLAFILLSFFEITVISSHWAFLIKALEEILCCLVVTCSCFLKFFKYKWGQRGKPFLLGKIFLVCVDLMSFSLLHSRTSSISWLNSLISLIIVRILLLFVFV